MNDNLVLWLKTYIHTKLLAKIILNAELKKIFDYFLLLSYTKAFHL